MDIIILKDNKHIDPSLILFKFGLLINWAIN